MANLGHKVWATDDILSAVDLNGYLADQVVMYFANATARTAGITYPVEGMVTYLGDSNSLWHYDGSAWVGIPTGRLVRRRLPRMRFVSAVVRFLFSLVLRLLRLLMTSGFTRGD